jgi:hypothetical protein
MKFKTLRKIDTKEFVHIYVMGATLSTFAGEMPNLMTASTTMDGIKEYYGNEISPVVWDNLELIELDVNVSEDLGADIRNKLTPFKNLLAMIIDFDNETNEGKKFFMKVMIANNMKKCEESIEYLAKLL